MSSRSPASQAGCLPSCYLDGLHLYGKALKKNYNKKDRKAFIGPGLCVGIFCNALCIYSNFLHEKTQQDTCKMSRSFLLPILN